MAAPTYTGSHSLRINSLRIQTTCAHVPYLDSHRFPLPVAAGSGVEKPPSE
jgi:hypothetical protein